MALFEGKTTAERNKLIGALVLGLVALVLIFRMFFASDKPAAKTTPPRRTTGGVTQTAGASGSGGATTADGAGEISMPREIDWRLASYSAPDPTRNIFAFYVKPTPAPGGAPPEETPTPTPTPPPPVTLSSLQPAGVFARSGEFTLELSGDKFTPQTRAYMDGQELQTTFKGAQQLSAKVPALLIQAPGARAVEVRSPDGSLYSNTQTVNVMPAPTPQYTFIGIIGRKGYSDKAILKPNVGNDLLTVMRGDIVGGRFRVTSISERAVEFTDTQLNIKHSLPFTEAKGAGAPGSPSRFPQPPTSDDDEP